MAQDPATDEPTDTNRQTSDPPAARVERARWEGVVHAIALLLGAITDWIGLAAVCYLAPLQHWSSEATAAAVVALAGGTIVAKLRGKASGSTTAILMVPSAAKIAAAALGTASHHVS